MKYIKTLFVATIVLVFCILYVQNQEVFTHQFKLKLDFSVIKIGPYLVYNVALIGLSFFTGVLFSIIYGVFHASGKGAELTKKDQKIRELSAEISKLKSEISQLEDKIKELESKEEDKGETTNLGGFTPSSSS